jgi:hypothetical protein
MRTGLDFKSAQFDHVRGEEEDWVKMRGLEIWSSPRSRIWNITSRTNLKWVELIFIQSKDVDQYTSPGIQYYHVSKKKQYGWLIYSWIILKWVWDMTYVVKLTLFFHSRNGWLSIIAAQ